MRPGHFAGVLTVVAKLFHIVAPDVAFFGEKDYQQLMLVTKMVADLNFPLAAVGVSTAPEPDGLTLFGTSTNIDVVSERGEFLGGALAPGIEISMEALAARAAALRTVELVPPRSVIGKNTVECLQSGVLYGFAGQVDGLVRRILAELDAGPVTVLGTGGLAPLMAGSRRRSPPTSRISPCSDCG